MASEMTPLTAAEKTARSRYRWVKRWTSLWGLTIFSIQCFIVIHDFTFDAAVNLLYYALLLCGILTSELPRTKSLIVLGAMEVMISAIEMTRLFVRTKEAYQSGIMWKWLTGLILITLLFLLTVAIWLSILKCRKSIHPQIKNEENV